MKRLTYCPIPATSILLRGLYASDIRKLYKALGVEAWHFEKGEHLLTQGDTLDHYWLVVSGEVHAYIDHGNKKRTVVMSAGHGDAFGLMFAYSDLKQHPTNAMAVRDTVALRFPVIYLPQHAEIVSRDVEKRFVTNMMSVISQAARCARLRAFVLSHPTVEQRIVAYLYQKSRIYGSQEFDIPLDRQEMADFIDVHRCVLCNALSRLKECGKIDFRKKHFRILEPLSCYEY